MASAGLQGNDRAGRHRRHVVGPLILLGVGVLLLLNNLQLAPWSIWSDLWPYWPVLFVLLGIEAVVTGRVAWGTLVMLIVLLPIVGLVVSAGSWTTRWHDATSPSPDRLTSSLRQPLGDATSAAVEVEYGAGGLEIGPLAADQEQDTLADAQVYGRGAIRIENANRVEPGRPRLRIVQRDDERGIEPGRLVLGRLDVRLAPTIPIDLKVSSGVTDTTLRLQDLRVPNLTLETGASQTRLTLPAHGETMATIEGGAAGIEVTVPPNVAARIIVGDGPNAVSIDQTRFPKQGNEYRSPGFENAADRATLRIDVGATRLVVQ
jgi:hypothetical protein